MNLYRAYTTEIHAILSDLQGEGVLPQGLDFTRVVVEPPRDPSHGEMATNAAMVLAKPAGMNPRALAEALVARLTQNRDVAEASIAGPGFVNWRLAPEAWRRVLAEVLQKGAAYGDSLIGQGKLVNVEYVSANPTGPLTAGHARGAVVGDVLANLLAKAGYAVVKEYYINDAGNQVNTLARSAYLRYQEALGLGEAEIPAGLYPGEYLKDVGRGLAQQHGNALVGKPEEEWIDTVREFAVAFLIEEIKADLARMGIQHDVFSSERALVQAGAVDEALKELAEQGHVYTGVLEPPKGKTPDDWEPRPQVLFRATAFGDDVDRPLKKSDGSYTYFANDIAYHLDKYKRGASSQIDIWGADHGGYVKRMQAALKAVSGGRAELDVKLCQLVQMYDNGAPVRMSKRAGTFVTLRDVLDAVGADVVRFIMLTRKNDQAMDFDYAKVTLQSAENPVFYVQYAHARCHSVLRAATEMFPGAEQRRADFSLLKSEGEQALIRQIAEWPRVVEAAAEAHEAHRIAFYLHDLAAGFHSLWNQGNGDATLRFLQANDEPVSIARLALVRAVATTIASGLAVMGVEPAEEMR